MVGGGRDGAGPARSLYSGPGARDWVDRALRELEDVAKGCCDSGPCWVGGKTAEWPAAQWGRSFQQGGAEGENPSEGGLVRPKTHLTPAPGGAGPEGSPTLQPGGRKELPQGDTRNRISGSRTHRPKEQLSEWLRGGCLPEVGTRAVLREHVRQSNPRN